MTCSNLFPKVLPGASENRRVACSKEILTLDITTRGGNRDRCMAVSTCLQFHNILLCMSDVAGTLLNAIS